MTRMVTVKGLVLVEEITFGDEATVYVAVFEIDRALPLGVCIWELLSCRAAQGALEHKKVAATEDDTAAYERRMPARFPKQHAGQLYLLLAAVLIGQNLDSQ